MKQTYVTYIITLILVSTLRASAQDAHEIVRFDQQVIDLGNVKKGEMVKNQYVFTNISQQDVIIDLVSTCECTEATWSSLPVPPGEKGVIEFVFDSSTKDTAEPVDEDVYFRNIKPKTDNPYSIYLQYTYSFK